MKSSALISFAFAALAVAVKKAPIPDPFGLLFTHENYKGGRFFISDDCTPITSDLIGSIWIPTIEGQTIKCFLHDDEECGGGSVIVSYNDSQTDIPTKIGDQVMAAQCLYF
ncbi:hypothetical protein ACSS6W_007950 [Trichoderma asperelloides]